MINGKTIVGAMLVSQNADLLDITIPNLLKYCDWCLIVMDNQTEEVEQKVYKYQIANYGKIFVRTSSVPSRLYTNKGREKSYRERSKATKGIFRDDVFYDLRRILDWKKKGYEKIDILLWPDSDEIFTDYLPELLDDFWKSGKRAAMTKPVDVINDMNTIRRSDMQRHVHILRYARDFSAYPWPIFAVYHPLTGKTVMKVDGCYSAHLAYLNDNIRKWRQENWKDHGSLDDKLIKLDKSVEYMNPYEIKEALSSV